MDTFNIIECARRNGKSTLVGRIFFEYTELLRNGGFNIRRRGSNGCTVTAGWPTGPHHFSLIKLKSKNTKKDLNRVFAQCRESLKAASRNLQETSSTEASGTIDLSCSFGFEPPEVSK